MSVKFFCDRCGAEAKAVPGTYALFDVVLSLPGELNPEGGLKARKFQVCLACINAIIANITGRTPASA